MVRSWIAHSTVVRTVPVFWINLYILLRLLAIIQGLITTNSIMFSVWLYNQCKVSDYSSLIIRASDNKLDNKQIFRFTSNACWWLCYKFIMSHWFWCTSQVWRMLSRFFCSQKLMCIKLKIKQSRWGEEKWTTMYTAIILLLTPDPQGPACIIPLTKHGNENWCEQSGMSRPGPVQKKTIQPCTCMSLLKKLIMEYNVKKTIQLYFWCNACFLHKFLAYNWGISF